MKKASKKLMALFLSVIMLLSLTACKKAEKETTTDSKITPTKAAENTVKDEPKATPTAAATPTPAAPADPYPAFDFGQRTITVGIWWDYFYTSDHKSIADNPKETNTETAQMRIDNVRRIEKKYNCKIVYKNLAWQGTIDSINTSIPAGTPDCDIYLTDLQFGIPAVQNGLAVDLKSIAPAYTDLFGKQEVLKPLEGLGGTYFMTEQGLPVSGIYLGYNANMISDLALEDPQALYNKGQWTWEKFAEYCKKGTRDLDNDGTTDIYGYGGISTDLVNGLVMNNGGNIAAEKTEGLSSANTVAALNLINQLFNVDFSARPWSNDWNDNLLAWSSGKVMFWTAQAWSLKSEVETAQKAGKELPFTYHVVPYPTGPNGDGSTIYSPVSGNWYIIPKGVKDPDKVLQIFEEFQNWFQGDIEYRDDPSWIESCFTSEEDVKLALKCGENMKIDLWRNFGDYFSFDNLVWYPLLVDKTSTVAQAVEAAKPVLQAAIDRAYGVK